MKRAAIVTVVIAFVVVTAGPGAVAAPESDLEQVAARVIECRDIDEFHFCTGLGFTDLRPGTEGWREMLEAATVQEEDRDGDGDVILAAELRALDELSPRELESLQNRLFASAERSVGRMSLYHYVGEGVPIPYGFFEEHPELGIEEASPKAEALREAAATDSDIDIWKFHEPTAQEREEELAASVSSGSLSLTEVVAEVLSKSPECGDSCEPPPPYRYIIYDAYREQIKNYYCGPATMQMIDGADDGGFNSQAFWADVMGTESAKATAMYRLVDAVNKYTNWDSPEHGLDYTEIDTRSWSAKKYFRAVQTRVGVYEAPVVLHVRLEKAFFKYLAYDHSGHLNPGRGYSTNSDWISHHEPYDERDWVSGGNYTGKTQYVDYVDAWKANQDYKNHGTSWHVDIGA